jgi:hypothetical protein
MKTVSEIFQAQTINKRYPDEMKKNLRLRSFESFLITKTKKRPKSMIGLGNIFPKKRLNIPNSMIFEVLGNERI